MTTKYISGRYPDGYTLSAGYGELVIERTARVGGDGITTPFAATVVNQGTVAGASHGVDMEAGGSLVNGSTTNTRASIGGGMIAYGVANVINFGTIGASNYSNGVDLEAGGSIRNGSIHDTTALISGSNGVRSSVAADVVNFGTIIGTDDYNGVGVSLRGGGSLTNGSTLDTTAVIAGYLAAVVAATIANFGTIGASGVYHAAIDLLAGGTLTNGSAHDTTALISSPQAVKAEGDATVVNFGTIDGGVSLSSSGTITNGSKADTGAYISGVYAPFAVATIINYGTIGGGGGVSVQLSSAGGEVIAEAGSTFIGTIDGGGGSLVLAGGSGTISGLGAGGTLTGAVQATFIHVDTFVIEAGGSWTLAGPNKVDPVADLVDAGTLINSGALTIAGTLSVGAGGVLRLAGGSIAAGPTGDARIVDNGLVIKNAGRGTITVGAHMFDRGVVEVATGTLDFTSRLFGTGVLKIDAGATLEADAGAVSTLTATFAGDAATLALKRPNTFDATLTGFATGDVIDLLGLEATGASVNGDDQLVVVDGATTVATLRLSGNYAGATFTTAADGHGGTDIVAHTPVAPTVHAFIGAMAGFGAGAGQGVHTGEAWSRREPMLTSPRVALA